MSFIALAGGAPNNNTWPLNNQSSVDVRGDHAGLIRELGAAGIVLLKNENNTLPLQRPRNIAVFGNDAGDLTEGLYGNPLSSGNAFGYEFGVLGSGGGSGTGRFTYIVPPLEALKARSRPDGTLVQYVQNNTLINQLGAGYVCDNRVFCSIADMIFPEQSSRALLPMSAWSSSRPTHQRVKTGHRCS